MCIRDRLIDLGRNDLGRVCEIGTVEVKDLMVIEKYSHVMHIVSEVEGILKKNTDVWDLLKACFPAGTVTGAPKIRAMQLIKDLKQILEDLMLECTDLLILMVH